MTTVKIKTKAKPKTLEQSARSHPKAPHNQPFNVNLKLMPKKQKK